MVELGWIDEFLALPHERVERLSGQIGDAHVPIADFTHLPTHCRYIALMPQWDFLNFLAERGKRYRGFDLRMQAEATELIEEGGRVVGVRARTPGGDLAIRAGLVVGCDGRHSTVRERAGFEVEDIGAPIDVLWFRISRRPDDTAETFGHIETGAMMVMLNRGSYWQCAYVIPKDGLAEIKQRGLPAFRDSIVFMSPFVRDRIGEIASWDDVKLLTVAIDRLKQWHRPGLLCIGDAAHAMSPVGGVGINLAVQDAVATANALAEPLKARAVTEAHLGRDPEAAHAADAGDPIHSDSDPGPRAEPRAREQGAAESPARGEAAAARASLAAPARADRGHRHPPRAHPHAGGRPPGATRRGDAGEGARLAFIGRSIARPASGHITARAYPAGEMP